MPESNNRLSHFWQELKRRNVLRSLAVYAGTAFIILEAADIIFPRLGLPDRSIDVVLYLLILGAFINLIISWIYDITPKGVQRTKPSSEVPKGEKPATPNSWKVATYVSIVVIVGLIIFNLTGGFKQQQSGSNQSVIILPFKNYTGDDQLDFLISGMHSSLIGDVGRISGLTIKSKTTSDVYEDADMTLPQIAAELGVDIIIEPMVTCMGDSICFELKGIAPDEEQLWISEYRESKGQIFNLHNRITKRIADEVKVELSNDEKQMLAESRTADPEAIDAYWMGKFFLDQLGQEDLEKAIEYFSKAIGIDPDWAPPYAGMAEVGSYQKQMGFVTPSDPLPMMYKNLSKALELDPNSANSHYVTAVVAVWTEWDWEKAEQEFLKSIELNPNNALCRVFYAHLLMTLERYDEASIQRDLALEMDPLRPFILALCAVVFIDEGDLQTAITLLEKAISIRPDHYFAPRTLESAYFLNEEYDKSFEIMKMFISRNLGEEFAMIAQNTFDEKGYFAVNDLLLETHEKAAQDSYQHPLMVAELNMIANNHDRALDWLEKGYDVHGPSMPYISTRITPYEPLYDHPRFIAILEKMNLPLPGD